MGIAEDNLVQRTGDGGIPSRCPRFLATRTGGEDDRCCWLTVKSGERRDPAQLKDQAWPLQAATGRLLIEQC